jgi:hypothetical protein
MLTDLRCRANQHRVLRATRRKPTRRKPTRRNNTRAIRDNETSLFFFAYAYAAVALAHRYSIYVLFWYKSTNADSIYCTADADSSSHQGRFLPEMPDAAHDGATSEHLATGIADNYTLYICIYRFRHAHSAEPELQLCCTSVAPLLQLCCTSVALLIQTRALSRACI